MLCSSFSFIHREVLFGNNKCDKYRAKVSILSPQVPILSNQMPLLTDVIGSDLSSYPNWDVKIIPAVVIVIGEYFGAEKNAYRLLKELNIYYYYICPACSESKSSLPDISIT